MEDFEEIYSEGIEAEGEAFLEGLRNKRNISDLEKEYSKRVKEIRKVYEKSLKKDIIKKEEYREKKKNSSDMEMKEKEFKVQSLDLEKNWKEEKEIKIHSWAYKIKRKIKNLLYNITPNFMIYEYHKFKISWGSFTKDSKNFFKRNTEKISSKLLKMITYIKEGLMLIVSKIKSISNLFKNKKQKEIKDKKDGTNQPKEQDK